MKKLFVIFIFYLTIFSFHLNAQEVDARQALQAAINAMGSDQMETVTYQGAGFSSRIGQQYSVNTSWPGYAVPYYQRSIDYNNSWSLETYTRTQGDYPTFGRSPMQNEAITSITRGSSAWDIRDEQIIPLPGNYLNGIPYNELRQLEIAITPHGFLKAAQEANDLSAISLPIVGASDFGLSQFGRQVTILSFTYLGKYKINGTIDDQNLVELVSTWIDNPFYGDMDYEMRYTRYQNFDGIMFPMQFHTHQADPRLNTSHNYYEYNLTDVSINNPVEVRPIPDAVINATIPAVQVISSEIADGIWLLGGGSHNSLLVEFEHYVAIVDAPINEERSLAVLAEAKRLIPDKQVQYVVNTHHHFDHVGGLRTYLSQGTTIVTHDSNKEYYLDILFHPSPRTLNPDRMAKYSPMYWISRRPAPIETVEGEARSTGKYVITDGVKILEIYHVQDMNYELGDRSLRYGHHSEDMLMAYLPQDGILFNADLYSPPQNSDMAKPSITMITLNENIKKLRLSPIMHVPSHGQPGSHSQFLSIVEQ
jgi:glyoxylase-like metal-dependent hydrolase (beta-lactamase superfamily II)